MICAAVRALAALAAQCRDHVAFCRTPHAGADRLWRETSRRDGADRLAEQEAEREVTEPDAPDYSSWSWAPEVLSFFNQLAEDTLPRQPAYPPFNPLNHESSSVDGEAATVAGPPAEGSPVASVSADLDATGPPTYERCATQGPYGWTICSKPVGHGARHGYAGIFWDGTYGPGTHAAGTHDPEK